MIVEIESKEGRKTVKLVIKQMTAYRNFENEIPESGTTISGFADSYKKKKKVNADRLTLDLFDM